MRPQELHAWLLALPRATLAMLKPLLENDKQINVHTRLVVVGLRENEYLSELAASNTPLMWLEYFMLAATYLGHTARAPLLTEVLLTCWVCTPLPVSSFFSPAFPTPSFQCESRHLNRRGFDNYLDNLLEELRPTCNEVLEEVVRLLLSEPLHPPIHPDRVSAVGTLVATLWTRELCGRCDFALYFCSVVCFAGFSGQCFYFRSTVCFAGSLPARLGTPSPVPSSWRRPGGTKEWGASASFFRCPDPLFSAVWPKVQTPQQSGQRLWTCLTQKASDVFALLVRGRKVSQLLAPVSAHLCLSCAKVSFS